MELETITMEPEAAKAAYEDYAAAVRANHDAEDRAIADGYKALAEGKNLINLPQALAAGGTDTVKIASLWRRGLSQVPVPKLAICRANARIAYTAGIDRDGGCLITADKRASQLHTHNRRDRFVIPDGTFDKPDEFTGVYVKAIVPNIPPRLRPKRGLQLYTLLWEAEWSVDPLPPGDPALLRRLGGDLYIVLGTWDLTPLEQAVLSGRA
jgi:hypothetical protein